MSELQTLFLVFVVIYMIQCVAWVPQDAVAFRAAPWAGWRPAGEGFRVAAAGVRGVPGNPLPPLEGVAACQPAAAAFSPRGVARAVRERATYAAFAGMEKASAAGKRVRLGGAALLTLPTAAQATQAAAWIEKLRTMDESWRGAAIEKRLAEMLDFAAAADRLTEFEARTKLVRRLCVGLFFYLFLVVPLVVEAMGLAPVWPALLAAMLLLVAAVAWSFRRAHLRLYPAEGETRWTALLTIALSPVAAIRAQDVLVRDLFVAWHPLAVAHVLCAEEIFRSVAARMLREITFPISSPSATDDEAAQCEMWFRERQAVAMRRFLAEAGAKPEELLAAPKRNSAASVSYCPRCCQQYAVTAGMCADCGGIPLERLGRE